MRAVNEAWATLSDPARRAAYDRDPASAAGGRRRSERPPLTDEEDLLADLADDTPLGGRVVLPRWLSLLPVTVFVLSVAAVLRGGAVQRLKRPWALAVGALPRVVRDVPGRSVRRPAQLPAAFRRRCVGTSR